MRFGAAIFAVALTLASVSRAQPDERKPERPRLRLDESPDLPLLSIFRYAWEPERKGVARWQSSVWGSWTRRNLANLDWGAGSPHLSRGAVAPINPDVEVGAHGGAGRLSEVESRWPFLAPRAHWFEDDPWTTWAAPPLELSPALMPPWLARVDLHWAHALIVAVGCGRGGACSFGESFPGSVFVRVWDALSPEVPPTPWWECRERPLRLHRFGREKETFVVLHCDGTVPAGALETLSILARPIDVERPDKLPATASEGEWMPGVRVMHPRLLYVLHRISLEYPWRAIHLYSGYRPARGPLVPNTDSSKHARGRAFDIRVQGVDNEELLAFCHRLLDVGCGYYPNGKFVHFDVRYGGRGLWVDSAAPGAPSRYVDAWPGVVEGGRVIWKKK